jgi:hypothetical protein
MRRAAGAAWAAPLVPITAAYERVRFGDLALDPDEMATVEAALATLTLAVRTKGP